MNRKKELVQQYKEMKTEAGIYQIKNKINQKIYIEATRNVKTIEGKKFQLTMGSHINRMLQQEWNEHGEDAFEFEVLEILKQKETGYFDVKDELKKLEEKWFDKLQPYGEKGYHKPKPVSE